MSRIGFFFFFSNLLNNPVEKRSEATIGWKIRDCPLVFYFIVMSWWILCSLKVRNWLAQRTKVSDSPRNRNGESQSHTSSFLHVPTRLRDWSSDELQKSSVWWSIWWYFTGYWRWPKGLVKTSSFKQVDATTVCLPNSMWGKGLQGSSPQGIWGKEGG